MRTSDRSRQLDYVKFFESLRRNHKCTIYLKVNMSLAPPELRTKFSKETAITAGYCLIVEACHVFICFTLFRTLSHSDSIPQSRGKLNTSDELAFIRPLRYAS